MPTKALSIKAPRRENKDALLFLAPFLVGFLAFNLFPVLYTFVLSFLNFNNLEGNHAFEFLGLQNYIDILGDEKALFSYLRTMGFSVVFVVGVNGFGLLFALLLNQKFYGKKFTTTLYLIPYVSNVVAIVMVWTALLDPYQGPINGFLQFLGIENPPMWLGDPSLSLVISALVAVYLNIAFQIIVLLAALQEVPKEMYEAAEIEGVPAPLVFFRITIPFISPTIVFLTITSMIESFQNFTLIKLITNGGPGTSSTTASMNIFNEAFKYSHFSYSASQAVILFFILFALTILQWKIEQKGSMYA